ncbi:MAG: ribonuclease III [Bacillota bacterium]|nr:ribonuclease III [Bacillota bacterium]
MEDLKRLEEKIGYVFGAKELLINAVTHGSYIKEHDGEVKSNERLEFLGDAFFDAIIGEELYKIFPHKEEGFLSRVRASLVCEKSLAIAARSIDLGPHIRMGNGEEKTGGRNRESILADTMEAIIGAVYLDGGFEAAKASVLNIFRDAIEDAKNGKYIITDYKTALQEKLQHNGITDIKYVLIGESGPDHDKTFKVQLVVNGKPEATGEGKSKKQAEQNAAEAMIER